MKILALILLLCYNLSFAYCGRQDGVCPVDEYQCGKQNGGRICPSSLCCSSYGWCGTGDSYCGAGCQNNCPDENNPEPECGDTVVNKLPCSNGKCCSQYGFCGDTVSYCDSDCLCQSNCWSAPPASPPPPPPAPTPPPPPTPPSPQPPPTPPSPPPPPADDGVASIITKELFEEMLLHRNDAVCPAKGFYTYEAFIAAANFFEGFGTTGDLETRKRELAAFFGQTSHETTGGWPGAPDGPYAWGYCFKEEIGATDPYCAPSIEWPCCGEKKYYGRGPIQISYNYNYGPAGRAIDSDLLCDPDLVASDSVISFETAIWFWMTPQSSKPSCHEVMIGEWTPPESDIQAGRLPGYGVTTNIINGGLECGIGTDARVEDRIGFYKRYCDLLGVSYGDNLDCNNQRPFGSVTECYGINCVVDM